MVKKFREVPVKKLRRTCPPSSFKARTTAEVEPAVGTVAQERALEALKMGMELYAPGYNIFVAGLTGTGRMTTVKQLLEEIQPQCTLPPDRAYVYHFRDPDRPRLLTFPRGVATAFAGEMEEFVRMLRANIPRLLEGEQYAQAREAITEKSRERERRLILEFEERLGRDHFVLGQVKRGMLTFPDVLYLHEGKPRTGEELEALVEQGKISGPDLDKIREQLAARRKDLAGVMKQGRRLQRETAAALERVEQEMVGDLVAGLLEDLREQYDGEAVQTYLAEVQAHVLAHLDRFKDGGEGPLPSLGPPAAAEAGIEEPFLEYRVNVVVDNRDREGCPVVLETSPTYRNLFGTIEKVYRKPGYWHTDFTRIRGGSLLQADGGYLVLNALEVLLEPGVWHVLKRTLKYGLLEIESPESRYLFAPSAIKPEPIQINCKVILIGDEFLYRWLNATDLEFRKIFKVKADFSPDMPHSPEGVASYAAVLSRICREEGLPPFDRTGMAAMVEQGMRLAGRQDRLTARFAEIADLARQAAYYCRRAGDPVVTAAHVAEAETWAIHRHNLTEERVQEMIEKDVFLIDSTGERVGQVNGLTVYDLGDYQFGRPARITANVAAGKAGIINIEREAKLSGRLHDKGVLILSGFLRERYARTEPLSLSASLAFEQSYGGVDGDSATAAEIYCLLSALSGLPLRQGVAVTGSMNQKGDVQPIGGVNEKTEGFFAVCRARGLTGDQGVIIPRQNVESLMLSREVVAAVQAGQFHVWPITHVDEGMAILTGVPVGRPRKDGTYKAGTVNARVMERLKELSGKDKANNAGGKRAAAKSPASQPT